MRFIMIGGFLGAGKTTTVGRLAKHFQDEGLRVGIVTNDQATDLVDTHTLRSQGFNVGEVAGACFCCNFNELTDTTDQLQSDQQPDIILAEPVGSCTDLVATVVRPLQHLHQDQYEVAPYGVILKPSHGKRILSGAQNAGFSPKAAYIFEKQLEEADFVIINRIDQLSSEEIDELNNLLLAKYPDKTVIRMSALTGEGFDDLVDRLNQPIAVGANNMELDYDIYAEGEAELGWLNSSLTITSQEPFELDQLVLDIVEQLRTDMADQSAETAHLKTIAMADNQQAVANLVSSDSPAQLSLASYASAKEVNLIVNARVAINPAVLQEYVIAAVTLCCKQRGATADFNETQSFRPGRPVPTHRIL